jgi:hypothetical protein
MVLRQYRDRGGGDDEGLQEEVVARHVQSGTTERERVLQVVPSPSTLNLKGLTIHAHSLMGVQGADSSGWWRREGIPGDGVKLDPRKVLGRCTEIEAGGTMKACKRKWSLGTCCFRVQGSGFRVWGCLIGYQVESLVFSLGARHMLLQASGFRLGDLRFLGLNIKFRV